jgi:hypothetical protein
MGFEYFATQNSIALPGKNFDRFPADYPTLLYDPLMISHPDPQPTFEISASKGFTH